MFFFLHSLFLLFIFIFILKSLLCSDGCPFQYHQSHLYISQPILSAIKAGQLKSKLLFGNEINLDIESRSFGNQPSNSLDTDFTKNNTNDFSDELQHSIRFASLSLAAQNIFHDLIVRRIESFMRLIKITKLIWHS